MRFFADPRSVGLACAAGAALLGLAYMACADAPMAYLAINTGAFVVGLALLAVVGRIVPAGGHWSGALTVMGAMVLLVTALLGDRVEGAARWVNLGGLFVQPSLVLVPVMIVGFARSRTSLTLAGMVVTAAALAIQPDRAMAGMLVAGLMVLAVMRPDRLVIPALAGSIVSFAVTLFRADTLPAVPYVDQILYSSFEVHALAGLAVLFGAALLIVPALLGWLFEAGNRELYPVFGAVWVAAILAAVLGNYPTPVVGYGGSAVLGYLLSLSALPKAARASRHANGAPREGSENSDNGPRLLDGTMQIA